MSTRRRLLQAAMAAAFGVKAAAAAETAGLAPQSVAGGIRSDTIIKADDGRDVRVSHWPALGAKRGTILFSHGALSAPEKYERVILPWSAAGFEVMGPLHVDSTDHPDHARFGMLESWRARLLDMRALAKFAHASEFVAAGHSYGGLVALTWGGAQSSVPSGLVPPLFDERTRAVVAFSPPGPAPGLVTRDGYGGLRVPSLIQTGDRDEPFGAKDGRWQDHLTAYEAAKPGDSYALVLRGVDHYFGGLICKPESPGPPQDAQLAAAVYVSLLFMDAFALRNDAARLLLEVVLSDSGPVQLSRRG